MEGGICKCNNKTIGDSCSVECINGYSSNDSTECICTQTCYTGYACNTVCNNNGVCDANGDCLCDFHAMVTGPQCDEPGCPGEPDCSDHGTCVKETGCQCDKGWKGIGCEIPDCDCNNITANCEQREGDLVPRCYNCTPPYIGDKCQKRYDYTGKAFYALPHNSGGVLSYCVGCLCVCPSVCGTSIRPSVFSFPDNNFSKCPWIFTKLGV